MSPRIFPPFPEIADKVEFINNTIKYISNCDLLIVAGTSLTVYPASGFISYFRGKNLVIINKMTTSYDNVADLVIDDDIEYVFKNLK